MLLLNVEDKVAGKACKLTIVAMNTPARDHPGAREI